MILAIGIYLGYFLLLLIFTMVWVGGKASVLRGEERSVSVVVPFRNEEKSLAKLVDSLMRQAYNSFEVIFVNDGSEDDGLKTLNGLLSEAQFPYQIHDLKEGIGKKKAINKGIELAKHDLIVTTDADCTAKPNWLSEMTQPFHNDQLQMLVGPVVLTGNGFWHKMQSIEFSSLIGTGGALLMMKRPTMANGANLAYRKSAFTAVKGFKDIEQTPSGDDELLMHKMKRSFPAGIKFNRSSAAVIQSEALDTWAEFKQQRLRWASKWKVGLRLTTILSALIVMLIQLVQMGLLVQLFVGGGNLELIASLLLFKLLIEFIFLWSVRRSLGQKMHGIAFLVNYLLYPFYAIYFGIAANFGQFEWKGRGYN